MLFRSHADPAALIRLIQDRSRDYRLEGPLKLRVSHELDDEAERFEFVAALLARLAPGDDPKKSAAGIMRK